MAYPNAPEGSSGVPGSGVDPDTNRPVPPATPDRWPAVPPPTPPANKGPAQPVEGTGAGSDGWVSPGLSGNEAPWMGHQVDVPARPSDTPWPDTGPPPDPRATYWPSYRPLAVDPRSQPEPPPAKHRIRPWLVVGLPWLALFALCGGCLSYAGKAFDNWDCAGGGPPAELLDPLPAGAEVVSSVTNRDCTRTVELRAADGGPGTLQDDLIRQLGANRWVMSETSRGWEGFRAGEDGNPSYSLIVSISTSTSARGVISIEISESSSPSGGTVLGGVPVSGPMLAEPRFAGSAGTEVVVTISGTEVEGYDARSSARVWRAPCVGANWASVFATPAAETVVARCEGGYTGIRIADGSIAWTYPYGSRPPDRVRVMGETLTLNSDDGLFQAIDVSNGKLRFERTDLGSSNGAANLSGVFSSNDTFVGAYELDGSSRWKVPLGTSGLYASDEVVFARARRHNLVALDSSTGAVIWQSNQEPARLDWSDVVGVTDNSVVVYTAKGDAYITAFDRKTGAKLWGLDVPKGDTWFPTVGPGDVVAIAQLSTGKVRALDDRTGNELRAFDGAPGRQAATSNGRVAYVALHGTASVLTVGQAR